MNGSTAMKSPPSSAIPLHSAREHLSTALLSDALDSLGWRGQVLPPSIRPLDPDLVMVGRARTGLYQSVFHVEPGENPYELEIALIDDLKPDDIAVLACGASTRIAPWGELLTNASLGRRAAGCVTDGFVRDTRAIRALAFPVFAAGISALDAQGRGKVVGIDVPVEIAGVAVNPGDIIFGDADGVIVLPEALAQKAFEIGLKKVALEDSTRAELRAGARLADVFKRHGIL